MKSKGFWNLPNSLTVLRIALVPVMVWLLREEPTNTEEIVSLVIFIGAMITDIVDGPVATQEEFLQNLAAAAAALKNVVPKVIDFIDGRDVNDL